MRWEKWERTKEWERKTQSKSGQTGPRLAEVASGPQTINKERSNLWTGSLISTLLLFSHLIDGLQCRFVLPPLQLQQLLFFPAFLSSFLSFSHEINTHRLNRESHRQVAAMSSEKVSLDGQKIMERKILLHRSNSSYFSTSYIDNNFDLSWMARHCIRKYVRNVLIISILHNTILKVLVANTLRIWQSRILFSKWIKCHSYYI